VILIRLLLFISFFYIGYFILRKLVIRPFREGMQSHGQARNASTERANTARQEGEVSVTYDPKQSQARDNGVGEYIDYEEVRDEDEKK
tara:strand:+ start:8484 stop:8747 length:264 start_codon:yes stop_codon:yes gene_type:complete